MNIAMFVLNCRFGGGLYDWEWLNELMTFHEIDISERELMQIDIKTFNDLVEWVYDQIERKWNNYISQQEGIPVTIKHEVVLNYSVSRIDAAGVYHDHMFCETAYHAWAHLQKKK